jgi:2-polyprenyl-6-hydroxyphenyl methylase/3-demethylubiquinone-9 3-methyltransferase
MIKPSELAAFARSSDLELQLMRGMAYNPLTKRYWMSDDTSVNYLMATRKAGA